MTVDIEKLKAAALAATPGPWSYDGAYVCPARVEGGTTYAETWRTVAYCYQPENTQFIAAANPAAVLELIAENERLVAQLCVCPSCHGEGETYTGRNTWEGHFQPPEPIMEKCGECDGDGVIGDASDLTSLLSENAKLKAENEALREALRLFSGCAYPVSTEIDARGYRWSEAWLDEALESSRKVSKEASHD